MLRCLPLVILLSACGSGQSQPSRSSVTITLPPPKPLAAPGFSSLIADPGR